MTARWPEAMCIAVEDVACYLALIATLDELQLDVTNASRPRTLRHRYAIADAFSGALSEILSVGSLVESAMRRALEAPVCRADAPRTRK